MTFLSIIIWVSYIGNSCAVSEKNNYWTVKADKIVDLDGKECQIKSMGFSNNFWERSKDVPIKHNNEESYKELNSLGFNSVRFCMTYDWFEDDENPYVYHDTAWEWIDKNIEWAKKYNIKLILNMHIAQGGKLVYDEGLELWNNEDYQKRFIALWKEIAKHYMNEDTVLGYDLLNEPYVTYTSSKEESFKQWDTLANKTIDEIRKVDNKHIVFLDRTYGAVNMMTGEYYYPDNETDTIPLVKDSNVVYQVHFYEPTEYTHQSLTELDEAKKIVYPDNDDTLTSADNTWKSGIYNAQEYDVDSEGRWQYLQSDKIQNNENSNNACFAAEVSYLDAESEIYIDDVIVKEYDEKGEYIGEAYRENFDNELPFVLSDYDKDIDIEVKNGQLTVAGKTGKQDMVSQEKTVSKFFQIKKGYYYQVCLKVNAQRISKNSIIRPSIYFYKAKNTYNLNKEYMKSYIADYMNFSKENNVPLFVGEFGVCDVTIKENLGGEKWVSDMINIMNDYGINYSYHAYHEENFGLHMNFLPIEESKPNEVLYKVFKDNLAKYSN